MYTLIHIQFPSLTNAIPISLTQTFNKNIYPIKIYATLVTIIQDFHPIIIINEYVYTIQYKSQHLRDSVLPRQPQIHQVSNQYSSIHEDKSTKKHPFPSKFISPHEIQWDSELTFPQALYSRTIAFEIYIRHQFGYHEQELNSILQGQVKVERDTSTCNFQIRRTDSQACIGYLSCRVRHKTLKIEEEVVEAKPSRNQILTIRSIIAHIPVASNKTIKCQFSVGYKQVKTVSIRTVCGDLVFIDRLTLHKTDIQIVGILSVYELKGNCEVKLGEGRMHLTEAKPEKKVILVNNQDEIVGQAFVDCTQEDEEDEIKLKSSSLPNYINKIKPSNEIMKDTSSTGKGNRFRKLSIVSPNQSIIFSTSQRFKQTSNPQFLGTRSSNRSKMSFGQLRISRKLNKSNQKFLFSIEEQIPGVGSYKLPTIWDRY